MYLPNHFHEPSVPVMHDLMREFPLATLITHDEDGGGLTANHIPLLLDAELFPFGILRGHVARANPLWQAARDADILVLFHGPQSYISRRGTPPKPKLAKWFRHGTMPWFTRTAFCAFTTMPHGSAPSWKA